MFMGLFSQLCLMIRRVLFAGLRDGDVTLPESWGQVVSSIRLSTIDTLEFDNVVGELLSKELRKKSILETSSPEALVVRGRSKEK